MLANDSTEADKRRAFFLVVRTDQAVAELLAECPRCGAITSYGLELALQAVGCSECSLSMQLDESDLKGLPERLIEARVRIDALIAPTAGTGLTPMPRLELFPFRYRDRLTGKWVRARYVAERHEMAARHTEWGIMGGRRDPQRRRRRLALRHDAPFCPLALLLSAVRCTFRQRGGN